MEPFQVQFFVNTLVIAGAACMALLCDLLKRDEEKLRDPIVKVRVRREDDQKLAGIPAPQAAPIQAAPKQRSMRSPEAVTKERKRSANADALRAIELGEALAGIRMRPTAAGPAMLSRNAESATLPEGFQDGSVLRRLVESRCPVTGLVVSIGMNESSDSLRGVVESLIGANDFAAQSGENEFLLIYPEERGAPAQRKLNEIGEKLRGFKLRWGAVEVCSKPVDEAIASATERIEGS